MKTIAIVSQKGGTGKTTMGVHLGVAAERAGENGVIIDLDPRRTRRHGVILRQDEGPAVVLRCPQVGYRQTLKAADEAGAELAMIDTPARSRTRRLEAAGPPTSF